MMMADILIERFRPMRERAAELRSRPERVREVLAAGRDVARAVAQETMAEVREAMGLWQTKRSPATA
jgi:tryptophanyl-tRNA synthetase